MAKFEPFGDFVRRHREEQGITLRKFAQTVEMSPTYLSKVERGELPPPGEKKVKAIARALNIDPDELLARAGRVATDLEEIIQQRPRQLAVFLRSSRGLTNDELDQLITVAQKRSRR